MEVNIKGRAKEREILGELSIQIDVMRGQCAECRSQKKSNDFCRVLSSLQVC